MEPIFSFEDLIEIEVFSLSFSNRGMGAVIDDFGRTNRIPGFKIIDPKALSAADDIGSVDPEFP